MCDFGQLLLSEPQCLYLNRRAWMRWPPPALGAGVPAIFGLTPDLTYSGPWSLSSPQRPFQVATFLVCWANRVPGVLWPLSSPSPWAPPSVHVGAREWEQQWGLAPRREGKGPAAGQSRAWSSSVSGRAWVQACGSRPREEGCQIQPPPSGGTRQHWLLLRACWAP